jgi:hypothetical protein
MSRKARLTTLELPIQAGVPGAVSGRQRRHGRKPAASAAAAQANQRKCFGLAAGTGQTGRQ